MRNFNKFILNIDNLECNVSLIKRLLKDNVKLCAVVKADAYGMNVDTVVPILDKYVDMFAVSNVFEAKQIRELGIGTDILVLGEVGIENINYCVKHNITISVGNFDYIKAIYPKLHSSIKVHLKINTGLNRYGIKTKSELKKCLDYIKNHHKIVLDGVFTHFATKREDIDFLNTQKCIFDDFCTLVPKCVTKHCANSFATIFSSSLQYDMVRIGINMYGDLRDDKLPLKDVLRIESEIVAINIVKKYQSIGYDRTFVADRIMKVAVVPLGYADGISRKASNKFYVIVNDKPAKIVGNVCMDSFMIDITDIPYTYIGSQVIIVGDYVGGKISIGDWARATKTSPYDILLKFRYRRCEYIAMSTKNKN